ncbi:MAG: NUDIX hydrolase [Bacteroidota bacterium]
MTQKYKVFLSDTELEFKECGSTELKSEIEISREDIIRILEKRVPASRISILSENPEIDFQKFCTNFICIDAGGGLVYDALSESYIMILRNGNWDFPKGKMDPGEDPQSTAIREVEEECGINGLSIIKEAGVSYHAYLLKGMPALKRTFWYQMRCDGIKSPSGQIEEGITRVEWIPKEKVSTYLKDSYISLKQLWAEFNCSGQDNP